MGSRDQGEVECDEGAPDTELLPLGVGEEEKRSSRPGLFQLALDVPGVGLDSLAGRPLDEYELATNTWDEPEIEDALVVERMPMFEVADD